MIRKTIKTIFFLLIFGSGFCFSQTANLNLVKAIQESEKVLLISHEDYRLIIEQPGNSTIIDRELFKDGLPNAEIIQQQIELNPKLKSELADVISYQKNTTDEEGVDCFWPHHSILLYRQGKWSYVDLCFSCDHYAHSPDLIIRKDEFLVTYEQWRTLENFFRKLQLDYKLQK
ncbi:hypothetical protein [Flavobacterium sp.]|uniref:hypothetical protein n=1 Tax=Flavobacterium sp. TaxID=239 RepID=UPI0039E3717B